MNNKNLEKRNGQPRVGFATTLEAAEWLSLSRGMIHKMIEAGEIPVRRFGRAVRIPWEWLRAQAEDGR